MRGVIWSRIRLVWSLPLGRLAVACIAIGALGLAAHVWLGFLTLVALPRALPAPHPPAPTPPPGGPRHPAPNRPVTLPPTGPRPATPTRSAA